MRKIFPPKDLEKYGALKYACAGFLFFLISFILLNKLVIYTLIVLLYFVINKSMKWSVFYCLHTINNKCQCCKSHFISYKLIELIRKVSKKIFRTHTKTFGGKIWVNLHSVSPGNILGKNLNRCCVKFPAKTYLNNISCEKIFSRIKFYIEIQFSARDEVKYRKAPWQGIGNSFRIYRRN